MENNSLVKVLLFGQTPPPYHGQSIMIDKILRNPSKNLEVIFIKMDYSENINEVGKFSPQKIKKLFSILRKATHYLLSEKIDMVYYPPVGSGNIPLYRDIVTLLYLRLFKPKIVFHFHALGLKHTYEKSGTIIKKLIGWAFSNPELCICLSEYNVDDIKFLNPANIKIVPYGIEEHNSNGERNKHDKTVNILFTGNIIASKGVFELLNALEVLDSRGHSLKAKFMGGMTSEYIKDKVEHHPSVKKGLAEFLGVCLGREKYKFFSEADIFCFPTFYESENLPVVLIEAMQYKLPVITTRWRGIPSLVENGENGFLIQPRDTEALIDKLESLIQDEELRLNMGKSGRKRYQKYYTEKIYLKNIDEALLSVADY